MQYYATEVAEPSLSNHCRLHAVCVGLLVQLQVKQKFSCWPPKYYHVPSSTKALPRPVQHQSTATSRPGPKYCHVPSNCVVHVYNEYVSIMMCMKFWGIKFFLIWNSFLSVSSVFYVTKKDCITVRPIASRPAALTCTRVECTKFWWSSMWLLWSYTVSQKNATRYSFITLRNVGRF